MIQHSSLSTLVNRNDFKVEDDLKFVRMISKSKFPVYLVFSHSSQKYLALKLFPLQSGHANTMFLSEERFTDLSHPNIASVIRVEPRIQLIDSQNKDQYFSCIIMELAPYGSFNEFISVNKIYRDESMIRTYFRQLIDALEYLHSKEIAHLDLKLENLVLGEDFLLKIIDFDCAYKKHDLFVISRGTKNYRAPEIIRNRCKKPMSADIFSAGIILFTLKYANLPYIENTLVEGVNLKYLMDTKSERFWKFHQRFSPNDTIKDDEPDFRDLFLHMVHSDPAQRATIGDIKKSKWYNGPVYSPQELKTLTLRKHKITSLIEEVEA